MDLEELEAFLQDIVTKGGVPGLSVAVVKNGEVRWTESFGYADVVNKVPAIPDTVYHWFSMTKIVTATAVMQLSEQGKLGLDDALTNYLPKFPWAKTGGSVTIRHLLNHSSGLPNPIPIRWVHPATERGLDPAEFLDAHLDENSRLKSAPGLKADYSNLGYLALGQVITQASGQAYTDFVRQGILQPLNLDHTDFVYTDNMTDCAATGYHKFWSIASPMLPIILPKGILGPKTEGYLSFKRFYVDGTSYGGLIGSVLDAARFLAAHVNKGELEGHRILSEESVAIMQKISAKGPKLDAGLGWFRLRSNPKNSREYLEHLGNGVAFFNDMRIYPEQSLGIVVMGNSTNYDMNSVVEAVASLDWS